MFFRKLPILLMIVCTVSAAQAQTARGQAASPGQTRATSRLPQPPSGGVPTGNPASGPQTEQQRQAETQAKKATSQICKGC